MVRVNSEGEGERTVRETEMIKVSEVDVVEEEGGQKKETRRE